MKTLSLVFLMVVLTSCASVRVASDYDETVDFSRYKTFAFYKPGIDKADINDLEKKRILRAIEAGLIAKGFSKSKTPNLLVSIFTKTRENVNIYQNNMAWGYGWGWNPWYWGGGAFGPNNMVTRHTEGTLYIDLIDAEQKELVWQGIGTAALTKNVAHKQEQINKIVNAILLKYPPSISKQ